MAPSRTKSASSFWFSDLLLTQWLIIGYRLRQFLVVASRQGLDKRVDCLVSLPKRVPRVDEEAQPRRAPIAVTVKHRRDTLAEQPCMNRRRVQLAHARERLNRKQPAGCREANLTQPLSEAA